MTRTWSAPLVAAGLAAMAACLGGNSAYLAEAPGRMAAADTNAPVNQQRLPGVIEYDNDGTEGQIAKRRADAYGKMTQACHGAYRIESEGPVLLESGRDATATWVIHFTCVAADSTNAPRV